MRKAKTASSDATIIYPATGGGEQLTAGMESPNPVIFARHRSGPVYYWYEALSVKYLETERPEIEGNWQKLLHEVRDSHWIIVYDDRLREIGYAARRLGIQWDNISDIAPSFAD